MGLIWAFIKSFILMRLLGRRAHGWSEARWIERLIFLLKISHRLLFFHRILVHTSTAACISQFLTTLGMSEFRARSHSFF